MLTVASTSVTKDIGGYLMAKKRWMVSTLALIVFSCVLQSQTVTQMGFIIKKSMPTTEVVAILVHEMQKERLTKEAQNAQLITKLTYRVYAVSNKSEIATKVNDIRNADNATALIITDDLILNEGTVKFVTQKLASKKTPVISNRAKDTLLGILMSIYIQDGNIEKHINKISMSALGITFSDEFLAECVVDVE